jgi:hydrogenase maturation protease
VVLEETGEPAALIEAWREADRVVVIDAAYGASAPGTIHRFDANERAVPVTLSSSSSHALGVAEAIELSRALGSLPRRLAVYCVEAESVAPGPGLSPKVEAALPGLLARVLDEISAPAD